MTVSPPFFLLAGIVTMNPSSSALPGQSTIQQLTNGLGWWALVASLVGLVLGAAAWALGSHTNNYQYANTGRKAVLASGIAALLIGAAPTLVNFLSRPVMGFTESAHRLSLTGHARGLAVLASARSANGTGGGSGGLAGILRSIEGTVGTLSHTIGGVFSGVGGAGLVGSLTKSLLDGFFRDLLAWVASGAASLIGVLGTALSASTEPMLAGSAFRSEFDVMAVLSAGVALPLLAVGAIQAIVRQEPGALLRSALVRLPLALLFTGVSVQLVVLGLAATDQASAMVLNAAGDPRIGCCWDSSRGSSKQEDQAWRLLGRSLSCSPLQSSPSCSGSSSPSGRRRSRQPHCSCLLPWSGSRGRRHLTGRAGLARPLLPLSFPSS